MFAATIQTTIALFAVAGFIAYLLGGLSLLVSETKGERTGAALFTLSGFAIFALLLHIFF